MESTSAFPLGQIRTKGTGGRENHINVPSCKSEQKGHAPPFLDLRKTLKMSRMAETLLSNHPTPPPLLTYSCRNTLITSHRNQIIISFFGNKFLLRSTKSRESPSTFISFPYVRIPLACYCCGFINLIMIFFYFFKCFNLNISLAFPAPILPTFLRALTKGFCFDLIFLIMFRLQSTGR